MTDWQSPLIPQTRDEFIEILNSLKPRLNATYDIIFSHLELIPRYQPSPISVIIPLLHLFEETDRTVEIEVLKLFEYIQSIKHNYELKLNHNLSTDMSEKLNYLICLTVECSKISAIVGDDFLKAYSEQKDKTMEVYNLKLALMEKNMFKNMLSTLIKETSAIDMCIKYLMYLDILTSVDYTLPVETSMFG